MVMKKGDIFEGTVEMVTFPNKGVLTVEGTNVEVKNVLPGQRIRFSVKKKRKGKAEGRLLEVLEKSPIEMEQAACPHSGSCGGCLYQSLTCEDQRRLKGEQVLALLEPVVPDVRGIFEGVKPSPKETGFRNKMEFTFGDEQKDGPLSLGLHKRNSFYDIVTVDQCRIMDADFRKILSATLLYFQGSGVRYYHRMRHEGYLRHLLVRKAASTGEILVDLVTTTQHMYADDHRRTRDHADLPLDSSGSGGMGFREKTEEVTGAREFPDERELFEGWMMKLLSLPLEGTLTGILHTRNDSLSDAVKDEGTEILYGRDFIFEDLLGLTFKITAFSFFQTNSRGAEVLYETARAYIGDRLSKKETKEEAGGIRNPESAQDEPQAPDFSGKIVYDLYSGTGTIAQMLAPSAKKVIGVEIVEEAVEAAKENAALNGLKNCEFIAGDVLKVLDEIGEKPDFIVLDPPRGGVHPKALSKIIAYGADHMIYISCKPTSLARDLEILQEGGYEAKRICCVDLFVASPNIETVVLLSKAEK